jgi:antitoxin VapB
MLRDMPPSSSSASSRQVRLFRSGRHQAVRIPHDFELPGDEAVIRKEGQRLIIEPPPRSLLSLLAALDPIEDDLPSIEELPLRPVRL